jgi:hypothetical protein
MAAPTPMTQCRTHPASLAGWTCDACDSSLCPECVAEERFVSTVVESCSRCGGRALELKVHRSQRPYVSRLGGSVRFLVKPSTLLSLGALAIFCAVMSWLGGLLGLLLQLGATWGWYFHIFLTAARGGELDAPDFTDSSDFTGPLFRALASSFFVWGPAVLYAVFFGPDDEGGESRSLFMDPVFWLILGWGLFFAPITFMVAATNSSMLHLFNPVALVGWAFKLGKDYLIALGVVGAAMLVGVGLDMLGEAVEGVRVPFVSSVISEALSLMMPFFSAHALGVLLHVHGDKIGYGMDSDYYEPALPGARPRGRLPSKAREPSAPAVGSSAGARMAAVLATGAGAVAQQAEAPEQDWGGALRAVADAVAARDAAGAVQAYKGLAPSAYASVAPEQHVLVGRAAVSTGDVELAAKAFETAADVAPESPLAPQALVLLARLCAERMKDPARATSVYRYILHRYPDTDASRFAAQRLGPPA